MNIGSIDIEKPLCLAPMEDVTDIPFRAICKRLGADILYTEFTSSEALIRDAKKALKKIEIFDYERPIGIQIFGGVEESMQGAVRVAEKFRPDFIDINCGCWVKDVALNGQGAGLLRDLPRFESIVKSVVRTSKLPVTVKTRLGWDEKSIVILDAAKMIEQAGVKALTVHCRTRDQGHRGLADWAWLTKIKKVISIPLIGNGDLETPEDIKRMFETGCDGVMVGRGAIKNPWVFNQTKHFLQTGTHLPEPSLKERIDLCIDHLKRSVEYNDKPFGVVAFRKFYAGYFHGMPNIAKLRNDLMTFVEFDQVVARLHVFLDEQSSTKANETVLK